MQLLREPPRRLRVIDEGPADGLRRGVDGRHGGLQLVGSIGHEVPTHGLHPARLRHVPEDEQHPIGGDGHPGGPDDPRRGAGLDLLVVEPPGREHGLHEPAEAWRGDRAGLPRRLPQQLAGRGVHVLDLRLLDQHDSLLHRGQDGVAHLPVLPLPLDPSAQVLGHPVQRLGQFPQLFRALGGHANVEVPLGDAGHRVGDPGHGTPDAAPHDGDRREAKHRSRQESPHDERADGGEPGAGVVQQRGADRPVEHDPHESEKHDQGQREERDQPAREGGMLRHRPQCTACPFGLQPEGTSSPRSASTLRAISSLMARTSSGDRPAGSSRSQSS